jgi:hypothetical protein
VVLRGPQGLRAERGGQVEFDELARLTEHRRAEQGARRGEGSGERGVGEALPDTGELGTVRTDHVDHRSRHLVSTRAATASAVVALIDISSPRSGPDAVIVCPLPWLVGCSVWRRDVHASPPARRGIRASRGGAGFGRRGSASGVDNTSIRSAPLALKISATKRRPMPPPRRSAETTRKVRYPRCPSSEGAQHQRRQRDRPPRHPPCRARRTAGARGSDR